MKISIHKVAIMALSLVAVGSIHARVFIPASAIEFYNLLGQRPLVVVHFVKVAKGSESASLREMKDAFRTLSRNKHFEQAGIAFVGVNLLEVPELDKAFPVTNESLVVLFYNGKALRDEQGNDAQLVGIVDEDEIENFIERYFANQIDAGVSNYRAIKYAAPVEVAQQPAVVYQNTAPAYYGTDYYDPGYYYGPGIGIGLGWGGWGYGGGGWGRGRGGRGFHGGGHRGGGGHHGRR